MVLHISCFEIQVWRLGYTSKDEIAEEERRWAVSGGVDVAEPGSDSFDLVKKASAPANTSSHSKVQRIAELSILCFLRIITAVNRSPVLSAIPPC